MDDRVMQFRVGVMVVATAIIAVILVLIFGEGPVKLQSTYTIYIKFSQAPGVTPDTPIRKSGVLIGRVGDVQLLDEGGVLVSGKIDSHRKLFKNEICRVNSSLLGDATLQFALIGGEKGALVQQGDVLTGLAAPDPLEVLTQFQNNFVGVVSSISQTSDRLRTVIERVGTLLEKNEDRINHIIEQAEISVEMVGKTMSAANELIDDPKVRTDLKRAIADAPGLLEEVRETMKGLQNTVKLADENLENIRDFTEPLGQHGDVLVQRLVSTTENLDTLTSEIGQFSRALNRREGTLGQLVNNPDLYQNLNRAAMRLDELSKELRPILNDARVFTDKIARHPESLGVRGALQNKPGIK